MKKKLFTASLALLVAAGCSAGGATGGAAASKSEDLYYVYTSDPTTIDYMQSQNASEHEVNENLVDGLTEVNSLNQYVGALAESWESNEDNTVWTFHLRDANWVTNTGDVYAPVKAQDFVTGLHHMADFEGGTLYIAQMFVKGLADYSPAADNWDQVGVKAVDEKTVEYTLTEPTPYFASLASYVPFYPIDEDFLTEKGEGCKLGAPDATACGFGDVTDPSSILYNGGYILDNVTAKSSIKMHKNEQYWDAENVHINNVNLVYNDGSDPAATVKGFEQAENPYYQATLLASSDNFAEYLEKYKANAFSGLQNQYTFGVNFNMNRITYNNTKKADASAQADTRAALLNKHFRRALKFGFDRVSYLATFVDPSIASNAIRNIECPWTFVATSDGKVYGELVQSYSEDPSIDLSEGQDSTYNAEKAKEEIEAAKKELDVAWPIHLDLLTDDADKTSGLMAASLKQSIEASVGAENVVIDVTAVSSDEYEKSAYRSEGPVDADWDISTSTGWGYDYIDPKTYLNIFSPVNGDVLRQNMGLEFMGSKASDATNEAAIEASGLAEYQALLDEAYAITDDMDARYNAEAKAEAFLLDNAIAIPVQTQSGAVNWRLSRQVPFTNGYQSVKYKGRVIQKDPITAEEYQAAYEQWQKDVAAAAKA